MCHLEALKAVSIFSFLADHIHDIVNDLGALLVVALAPVVARAVLAKDHVVWAEELADVIGSDSVNYTWIRVD